MVRNAPALAFRELGGAYVEVAKDLQGIAIDNFAVEFLCDFESQIALAGAGGANYRNQRMPRCVMVLRGSVARDGSSTKH